jgi:hypothetical protein
MLAESLSETRWVKQWGVYYHPQDILTVDQSMDRQDQWELGAI